MAKSKKTPPTFKDKTSAILLALCEATQVPEHDGMEVDEALKVLSYVTGLLLATIAEPDELKDFQARVHAAIDYSLAINVKDVPKAVKRQKPKQKGKTIDQAPDETFPM